MLKEVRIHGRGGQGAVTMAEMIALCAYNSRKVVQAFPSFGVERRGAPVEAYVRISEKEISRRDHIANPDYLVILDPTLLENKGMLNGLDKGDMVLINSSKGEDEIKKIFSIYPDVKIKCIDAVTLAIDIIGKPIVNTALLGAFAFCTGIFDMKAVRAAIEEKLGDKGPEMVNKNIELAQKAYDHFDPHKQFVVIPGEQHLAVVDEDKMVVDS
ncbi:MAG TPA: 2-oxoacid:acceptor oxidoreductase family protein [Patescibacteria group bacterium]|nr:2-oxoacid:acceptor oxidoreductase family protein [Patescibacteria group bacterium]